jgi:hypothetical protein
MNRGMKPKTANERNVASAFRRGDSSEATIPSSSTIMMSTHALGFLAMICTIASASWTAMPLAV